MSYAQSDDQVFSLAYISTATKVMDDNDLAAILTASRSNNRGALVTGFLLHKEGRFFQFLEGPEAAVRRKMDVISADPRHRTIAILLEDDTVQRQFPEWAMGFERHDSHPKTSIPGYRAVMRELRGSTSTSVAIRELVGWFQARHGKDVDATP